MAKKSMVQAINEALLLKMAEDPSVMVMGEDVGVDGGVFRATLGLLEKFGTERVFDTPLAESSLAGIAVGLAMNQMKPVIEFQFMGFIYQGFDQILGHIARYLHRSQGRFPMSMVLRTPYGAGVRALEHHSESTEAHFAHLPGLKVVIPSTPKDAKGLLISAIEDKDPVVFLEPTRLYRLKKEEVPEEIYRIPIGKANLVKEGKDLTLIGYGAMIPLCLQAAEHVDSEGVSVEVLDLRTISPLDWESIERSVQKTGRLIIVHEAPKSFGVGAEISALVSERCLLHLLSPVQRVTGYDVIPPLSKLEDINYPNEERIVRAIHKSMEY